MYSPYLQRAGADKLIFLEMRRISRGHYLAVTEKIYTPGEPVGQYEIIDRFFDRLEKQIRRDPSCWLWTHRRWKYADLKNDQKKPSADERK